MSLENETVAEIVKEMRVKWAQVYYSEGSRRKDGEYCDNEFAAVEPETVAGRIEAAHKREMDTRTIIAGAMLADAVDEAHKREVAELYAIIEKSQKDAETYRDERDGAMRHWREEKAKVAELRECLKEAIGLHCGRLKCGKDVCFYTECGKENECVAFKWRKALEGGNDEN